MQAKTLTLAETLMSLNEGGVVEDIQEQLRKVTKAVIATGKAGAVSISLKVQPNGPDAIKIVDSVKSTVPKTEVETTFYVVGDDAALTRRNPRQPSLDGVEV